MMEVTEQSGTFACRICGKETPHYHSPEEVAEHDETEAWVEDSLQRFRTLESLTRLERNWLKRRFCGFCETSCLAKRCGAMSGPHVLPPVEGVRDKPETVDLGQPCDMDIRRSVWLASYKPRHLEGADNAEG